jgi:DNA-binding Lrp family transcriptional regulator
MPFENKQRGAFSMEQLLKILEDNARLPLEDIAAMLDKSAAEVSAMMDLARAQGLIKGYKTLVDWEKAGINRVEAVIELHVSPKKSRGFDEIATTIASFEEVESVLLMSGGYDLQLTIKGKTFQEIALFVAKRLSPLDDVLSTATHFVLRTYKKEGKLYQAEEIDERECTVL